MKVKQEARVETKKKEKKARCIIELRIKAETKSINNSNGE